MIQWIEVTRHPGGLTRISAVTDGDIVQLARDAEKALSDPKHYRIEISKIKKKRSLDANAYYWELLDKLSRALRTSKDELHAIMLDRYGTLDYDASGAPKVFSIRNTKDPRDITPYSRPIGRGFANGKLFIHYAVLKGSGKMDSAEFAALLDGLISECKELGIETLPPAEIERLKEAMNVG